MYRSRMRTERLQGQVHISALDILDRSDTKIGIFRISYPDCSQYCDINLNSALYNNGLQLIINPFFAQPAKDDPMII